MVKKLDQKEDADAPAFPEVLDHVGYRLWEASRRWKADFDAGMIAMGHAWFAEARANLIPHIGHHGIRQALLVKRMGLTKQAVQQLIDELEADGIVARQPDPDDRRGRIVVFTQAGLRVLEDANVVKRRIESKYRGRLGESQFSRFMAMLTWLTED